MCGGHGHHERHARGFRGFGRGGFPGRDVWLERLQAYQSQLEQELANVRDVIERLGPPAQDRPGEI
jgi:hypothetical protein